MLKYFNDLLIYIQPRIPYTSPRNKCIFCISQIILIACSINTFCSIGIADYWSFFFPENYYETYSTNDTTLTREVIDSLISKTDLTEPTRLLIWNDTSSGNFYSVKCNTKVDAGIIFTGRPNVEEDLNCVWINTGSNIPNFAGVFYGKIQGFLKNQIDTLHCSFVVSADWCCGSDVGTVQVWQLIKQVYACTKKIKTHYKLSVPTSAKRIPPVRFSTTTEAYKIRATPCIDDTPDSSDMERYGVIQGNTLAELLKNSTGTAYTEIADTTGRKWWLVVMDKKTGTKNDLYKGWGERESCFAGWISSRFVKLSE